MKRSGQASKSDGANQRTARSVKEARRSGIDHVLVSTPTNYPHLPSLSSLRYHRLFLFFRTARKCGSTAWNSACNSASCLRRRWDALALRPVVTSLWALERVTPRRFVVNHWERHCNGVGVIDCVRYQKRPIRLSVFHQHQHQQS